MNRSASRPLLFAAGPLRAVELGVADVPSLQRFFETNPAYFVTVTGQPPGPDEAQAEMDDAPPAGWTWTSRWTIGFVDDTDALVGMASVVSDLLAVGIWHIGLFVTATALHGTGTAYVLNDALESWARERGAHWLRLGVVRGNARAERFWERVGYAEVRERCGVPAGTRLGTIRVMVKPVRGGELADYLVRVPRDRPGAP